MPWDVVRILLGDRSPLSSAGLGLRECDISDIRVSVLLVNLSSGP